MMRRGFLGLAGLAALAPSLGVGTGASAQPAADDGPPKVGPRLVRVWNDAAGESHLQELTIPFGAAPLPAVKMLVRPEGAVASKTNPKWHNAPGRVFAINLTGDLDVQTSDGVKLYVPLGGIAFLEDTAGKGHLTMPRNPVSLLFLFPPADFDVVAWCKGVA